MKIDVEFISILSDWVGARNDSLNLREGADFSDVMREIYRKYGKNMPPQLWDEQRGRFTHRIGVVKNGKIMGNDVDVEDGDCLIFRPMMAGG